MRGPVVFFLAISLVSLAHQLSGVKTVESKACAGTGEERACWTISLSRTKYTKGKESIFTLGVHFVQRDRNVLTQHSFCKLTLSLVRDTFSCQTDFDYSSDRTAFKVKLLLKKDRSGSYLIMDPPGESAPLCSSQKSLILTAVKNRDGENLYIGFEKERERIRSVIVSGNEVISRGRWIPLKDILKCP